MNDDSASAEAQFGVLLTVAYDGSGFSGWAPQPRLRTVAGELLNAVRMLSPGVREVRGASRTDAGVHARGQRAAFDAERDIPNRGWVLGLSRHLPTSISVRAAARVSPRFTPRFESTGKRYLYTLLCDPVRDPFLEGRAWRLAETLDLDLARAEAAAAVGTHDFVAFRGSGDARRDTVRTLRVVAIERDAIDARIVRVRVEGDGFLYNMVRILVGALVDVARGRLAPGAVARALASKRRTDLGLTAPAAGLLLDEVFLPTQGEGCWPEGGAWRLALRTPRRATVAASPFFAIGTASRIALRRLARTIAGLRWCRYGVATR